MSEEAQKSHLPGLQVDRDGTRNGAAAAGGARVVSDWAAGRAEDAATAMPSGGTEIIVDMEGMPALALATASMMDAPPSVNC